MSNSFSLDDIREAVEAKYGSTKVEFGDKVVELINPLQLPKKDREKLLEIQKSTNLSEDELAEADQEQMFADLIRAVANNKKLADELIRAIGGNLAVLSEIVQRYNKGTQAGEA